MQTQHILLQGSLVTLLICAVSTHPAIHKGSTGQSIEYPKTWKKTLVPDAATTVEQVQKILQADLSLPRLTKGEIEDLFEQVARKEYEKSIKAGDAQRADNMRALMLVLPFNTENTTDEVLQELYTRPPITKVIDTYSTPQPHKFQMTQTATTSGKAEIVEFGNMVATTYKPYFRRKEPINSKPTTYHPLNPIIKANEVPNSKQIREPSAPVTSLPLLPDIEEEEKKSTRYSSSYNAQDPDWSLLEGELGNRLNLNMKFTPMPDLAGIFKTMGLEQPPKQFQTKSLKPSIDIADFTRTLPPRPHLEAYSEFKPLNIGEEIRLQPDIEDYLNRFGIVNRKRKQIKPEDKGPDDNKKTEKDQQKTIRRSDPDIAALDHIKNNEDQISKLLNNLQELQRLNVSLSSDMLKPKPAIVSSSTVLPQGPNPVSADESSRKKQLKRQDKDEVDASVIESIFTTDSAYKANSELENDSTSTTTVSPSIESENTSKASEPQNGSLTDLEDSFGGPDPVTEDPSPPPKKNGFYFLADWNSFLEVGEAGGDQVVVRFDPKIGDPRRFLKVTVP